MSDEGPSSTKGATGAESSKDAGKSAEAESPSAGNARAAADPAPTVRRRPASAVVAFTLFALLVLLGAYFLRTRARAKPLARELGDSIVRLNECLLSARGEQQSLADALALLLPEERPLAGCVPLLEEARGCADRLAALRPLMARDAVDEVAEALSELDRAELDRPARALAAAGPEQIENQTDTLRVATCRILIAEGAEDTFQCARPPLIPESSPVPEPRVVLDEQTGWLEHVSLSLETRGAKRLAVLTGTLERDSPRSLARIVSSADAGATWNVAALYCRESTVGRPDAPSVAYAPTTGAPRAFLLSQRDQKAKFSGGTVGRVTPDLRGTRYVGDVPDLPAGLEPARAGSALLELSDESLVLVLAPSDTGEGGAVMPLGASQPTLVPVPEGRVVAGLAGQPARILLARTTPEGKTLVATSAVPAAGKKWAASEWAELSTGELEILPMAERVCGQGPGELGTVWRKGSRAAVALVGPAGITARPFGVPSGGDLSLSCGACAPTLFWRGETGLAWVPSGNAPQARVETPVLYNAPKSWRTAVGDCAATSRAVGYVQDGRVYVQTAQAGIFSRPKLLAAPDERGSATRLAIAGVGRRLVAVWQRVAPRPERLRIETLASDDGGLTWH